MAVSPHIELINTGSELLLGRILNTHQQWICRRLADLGYEVARQWCVADEGRQIQDVVRESLARADLIVTTGGLGPTSDDLTRDLVAQLLERDLVLDPVVLETMEGYFADMTALSLRLLRAFARGRTEADYPDDRAWITDPPHG